MSESDAQQCVVLSSRSTGRRRPARAPSPGGSPAISASPSRLRRALSRWSALAVLRQGLDPGERSGRHGGRQGAASLELLGDPAIRADDASTAASKVAAIPAVRAALLDLQREFAGMPPGDSGRGGARRPRHRHRHLPGRRLPSCSSRPGAGPCRRRLKELQGARRDGYIRAGLAGHAGAGCPRSGPLHFADQAGDRRLVIDTSDLDGRSGVRNAHWLSSLRRSPRRERTAPCQEYRGLCNPATKTAGYNRSAGIATKGRSTRMAKSALKEKPLSE